MSGGSFQVYKSLSTTPYSQNTEIKTQMLDFLSHYRLCVLNTSEQPFPTVPSCHPAILLMTEMNMD